MQIRTGGVTFNVDDNLVTEEEYIGQGYTVRCGEMKDKHIPVKGSVEWFDASWVKDFRPPKAHIMLCKEYEEKLKLAKKECREKYNSYTKDTCEHIYKDLLEAVIDDKTIQEIKKRIHGFNNLFYSIYGFNNWITLEVKRLNPHHLEIVFDDRAYDYFERVLLKDWLDKAVDKAYKQTKENNMLATCKEREDLHSAIYELCAPGATQEDIKVEVDNLKNEIIVTGKIKTELRAEETYTKVIRLPERYDRSKVTAEVKNGIITIKVPCLSDAVTVVEVK
jgi:HSP20 family molecular chaperone IbpA